MNRYEKKRLKENKSTDGGCGSEYRNVTTSYRMARQVNTVSGTCNIPYFHYSRKPLKEVYEKEYEVIKKKHEKEFINWLDNWKKYIREKYGNGDNK